MANSLFLVSFPLEEDEALHWWYLEGDALIAHGYDHDPSAVAEIPITDDLENELQVVALTLSSQTVARWHERPEEATAKQAFAAAVLEAKAQSLYPDDLYVAAGMDGEQIATLALQTDILTNGISILQARGLDPDIVTSPGFLLEPKEGHTIAADFGFDRLLRGPMLVAPDEPLVRHHLISAESMEELGQEDLNKALSSGYLFAVPNLRSGVFAKKTKPQLSGGHKKVLAWLIAALTLVSIAIPLLQLYKYHSAAAAADEAAMAAATKIVGPVENLERAEQQLDEKLLAENLGNSRFTVPAAGVFSSLQQVPGVSISKISYGGNGLMALELTAVRNEDINPALISIQQQGFVITATPRQDASGFAKADVTVRVP